MFSLLPTSEKATTPDQFHVDGLMLSVFYKHAIGLIEIPFLIRSKSFILTNHDGMNRNNRSPLPPEQKMRE